VKGCRTLVCGLLLALLHSECPVNSTKPSKDGYYIDDRFQYLLSLKEWLYNAYPPDAIYTMVAETLSTLWQTCGLPENQFLSSALVTLLFTNSNLRCTNAEYSSLLNCKINAGSKPLAVANTPHIFLSMPDPVDRYCPTLRTNLSQQMILLAYHS
jgi:hypothetical protein